MTGSHLPQASFRPLRVRVPGSTSNLGPGFDFAGLALSIYLDVEVLGLSNTPHHEFERLTGTAADWPLGPENLLLRALERGRHELGADATPLRFAVHSEIPVARGLGSSGAAIAAGLVLSNGLANAAPTLDRWLALGLEIEGHPDNTSASIAGGCTLAVPDDEHGVCLVRQELHRDLAFAIAWPEQRLSTRQARSVLPREVSFADAVENPRRLALLLEGLRSANVKMLKLGAEDRLHVKHRLALIPSGALALEAARRSGAWFASVSGSGSALFAIAARDRIEDVARAMQRGLEASGPAQGRVVEAVMHAPRVEHA